MILNSKGNSFFSFSWKAVAYKQVPAFSISCCNCNNVPEFSSCHRFAYVKKKEKRILLEFHRFYLFGKKEERGHRSPKCIFFFENLGIMSVQLAGFKIIPIRTVDNFFSCKDFSDKFYFFLSFRSLIPFGLNVFHLLRYSES